MSLILAVFKTSRDSTQINHNALIIRCLLAVNECIFVDSCEVMRFLD